MSVIVVAIVIVWSVLFGGAYLARVIARVSQRSSIAIITGLYLALCAVALSWLGLDWRGFASIAGMLVPYAISIGVILLPFRI